MNELEKIYYVGNAKIDFAHNKPFQFFLKAIMAGFYLGGAMIISYTSGAILSANYPEFGKLMIAFTFGLGLAAIVFLGAELFTGNCFSTMMSVYTKQRKLTQLIQPWLLCYVGNFLGIGLIGFLFIKSGSNHDLINAYLEPLTTGKMNFIAIELFTKGILCNFLVCIAAYAGIKLQNEVAKFLMIICFVAAFVLPGLDHCVANAGLFAMGLTLGHNLPMMTLVWHMLFSTLGNIVGGGVLLALPIYLMHK